MSHNIKEKIQALVPSITSTIREAASEARNEAEFRAKVARLIEDFASEVALNIPVREEYTLINGRADAVYNRLIIEYEPPGSLRPKNTYRHNQHAINQVKNYIKGLTKIERHSPERVAGVVLDGSFFIFVRFKDSVWHIDDPLPVTEYTVEKFLKLLSSLSTELALIPENLVRDFGENRPISRKVVSTLYEVLTKTDNPKVKTLFEQWSLQFSEISNYEKTSKLKINDFAKRFGITAKHVKTFPFFFALHTYYATFIKLLAVQVVHFYLVPSLGGDLKKAATLSSSELKKYLEDMEEGGIFKQIGITNFLEGDFFAWYLDIWDDSIYSAIQALISQLANYSLVTLDVDPEETRDLLKKLYQNIMPRQLRHNLGEYYTPDWLAERLLGMLCGWRKDDSLKVPNIRPDTRILDPACGSGTFLVLAIKRAKEYALSKGLPGEKTLQQILTNIVGFDLNPLAVISARTNYLLALGDLLKYKPKDFNITIPVYLCDSILTPQESRDLFTNGVMKINTAVGPFSLPTSLIKAQYIDQLADFLEESVNLLLSKEEFIKKVTEKFPLISGRDDKDLEVIYALYEKLLRLEKQGINGIWARIIKNAFAPLFVGEFDYIAGNPPWVNWESLPEQYRQETKSLWESYGLFPHGGMDTILGKGKKDISMIMTYVAMDRYLKKGGKLGFVITQSVFKTSGAGQGFRRFKIKPSGTPISVIHVDDMVELKPFEGASNRTAVVILKKGIKAKYPLRSYLYWKKTVKGKSIPQEAELSDVLQITETKRFVAEPVDSLDTTSPWLTGRAKAVKSIRKILGSSFYIAREGVNSGGANGVYWINIIQKRNDGLLIVSNITENVRKKVESVQAAIEPDLVYPLLRGRDVQRWYAEPSAYIILAQDPVKRKGIDENIIKIKYSKTYLYLKKFEEILLKRAAFRRYFTRKDKFGEIVKTGPFYSMFNVGTYTLAPYKVVWREQSSSLTVSVIGKKDGKPIIPDHKLMMISCSTKKEAFYLCGMLNSSPARYAAISYAVNIQYNPHLLENINVPRFDSTNTLHIHLAELSEKAHNEVSKGNDVSEIEAEIDHLAARIWGLSEKELREIQRALEEIK